MFGSNVQPKRRVRQKPLPWFCVCGEPGGPFKLNRAHLRRCPDCGIERQPGQHRRVRPLESIATSRARGAADPAAVRKEFRCACGYGIILTGPLPTCPMCQAGLWEQITGPDIGMSRRQAA